MTDTQDILVQELDVLDVEDIADKHEKLLFRLGIVALGVEQHKVTTIW